MCTGCTVGKQSGGVYCLLAQLSMHIIRGKGTCAGCTMGKYTENVERELVPGALWVNTQKMWRGNLCRVHYENIQKRWRSIGMPSALLGLSRMYVPEGMTV